MNKNRNKSNTLTKRKSLLELLKKHKVTRVQKSAINEIELFLTKEATLLAENLHDTLVIKGKKTAQKKDVREVVNDLLEQREQRFEI